ncbi:MAG: hypothetical protein JW798_09180 [Prolixibacteraceae bacterium]|nr:hypothetical protein [Prolixibacteraceae bacterium]
MKNRKFIRYSSTIGALLAISGGANAIIQPGEILNGVDGDKILDHNFDDLFIDIDNDGTPDFMVGMIDYSFYISGLSATLIYRGCVITAYSSFYVDNSSYASNIANKFSLNQVIGPLNNPYDYGYVSLFSQLPPSPPVTLPNFDGINGDTGYLGIEKISPSGINYGWIHVNIGPESTPITFDICAMEHTPDKPIVAGNSIPVPLLPIASAAGLGLIGLLAAMKKRKKVTA